MLTTEKPAQKKPNQTQKKYAKHVGKLLRRVVGKHIRVEQIIELKVPYADSYSNRWKYRVLTIWTDNEVYGPVGDIRTVECSYVLHSKYYELLE